MIRPRTWRGIVLLGLLAALTWILARPPDETATSPLERPDTRLNYALYDFDGRILDEQGAINLSMNAPVLRNDAESGIGTVESPEIHIQQEDERWYIKAESAIVSTDREQVTLVGEVYLSRRDEVTDQLLEISTSDVVLQVTPRTAMTESPVHMRQDNDRLDAVGMNLDMIAKRYELLQEVSAHYELP